MTGAAVLGAAVLALFPTDVTLPLYDGQVATAAGVVPAPPWLYVTMSLPAVSERSQARTGHLYICRVRVLVYAGTAAGVRIVADKVQIEGLRPVAAGWNTSPLELENTREAVEDPDVTIATTGKHPMYGVLEYLFTASPKG